MTPAKPFEQRRQDVGADSGAGADADQAPLEALPFLEGRDRRRVLRQEVLDVRQQELAGGGQSQAPADFLVEANTEFAFEGFELLVDGGRAEVQYLADLGDAPPIGEQDEAPKATQLHGQTLPKVNRD